MPIQVQSQSCETRKTAPKACRTCAKLYVSTVGYLDCDRCVRAKRSLMNRTCVECKVVFKRSRNGARCNPCEHAHNKAHGSPKTCVECKTEYKAHSSKYCLPCRKNKWRNGAGAERPSNSARSRRNQMLKRVYGIAIEQVDALYASQDGKCAICEAHKPSEFKSMKHSLVVDHDHVTGRVRGLLCQTCNSGMGQLRDSVDLLKKAIKYLERSNKCL